jgi:DNA ligase-associated metallophosphoesterase
VKTVEVEFGGQAFVLYPHRAAYWPAQRAALIADPHFGKASSFRGLGVPVPAGTTAHDLGVLSAVLRQFDAKRLIVLGDFFHARGGKVDATLDPLRQWRREHASLAITLIRGNHDRAAGDPESGLDIDVVPEPLTINGIDLVHHPLDTPTRPTIAGHVHPGVRLEDFDGSGVTVPAFVVDPLQMTLPAFGWFTGCVRTEPGLGRSLYAVAAGRVVRAR